MVHRMNSSPPHPAPPATPSSQEDVRRYRFDAGDVVVLHGLVRSTHVNGRRAVVHRSLEFDAPDATASRGREAEGNRRCMIRLLPFERTSENDASGPGARANRGGSSGRCISVKSKNLALDYPPGQRVLLHDLVSARHLNGKSATVVGFRPKQRNAAGKVGKFVVEVSAEKEERDDAAETLKSDATRSSSSYSSCGQGTRKGTAQTKQMLVSPRNVVHLPHTKPPPLRPTDQLLTFTGSMESIVSLLNQSVHKPMDGRSPPPPLRARWLLGAATSVPDGRRSAAASMLNDKIAQRSYSCRTHSDEASLPPHYQHLLPPDPRRGRTGRVCFHCHRRIPPGAHARTKRCVRCRAVSYCGARCARAAWEDHRKVCRAIRAEGVRFADHVALASPGRREAIAAQRAVRLCVNRRMSDGDNRDNRNGPPDSTARLIYNVVTKGGADVANHVLLHLESPPKPGREVTVTIGFNSLGNEPVLDRKDVQLFSNIFDCEVAYQVLRPQSNGVEEEEGEGILLEPNGEEVVLPGQVPENLQAGLMDFLNNLMPMGNNGNAGGNDHNDGNGGNGGNNGAAADNDGAAAAAAAAAGAAAVGGGARERGGQGLLPGFANFVNHVMNDAGFDIRNAHGDGNDNNDHEGLPPPFNAENQEGNANGPEVAGLHNNNNNDGAEARAAAAVGAAGGAGGAGVAEGGGQEVPPGLANFLNHVMNEAGVGIGDANEGDHGNHNSKEEEETLPLLPDVEEVDEHAEEEPQAPNGAEEAQAPNGAGGAFHFNIPGPGGVMGEAHVHVVNINGPGDAMPDGAIHGGMPMPMPMPPPGAAFRHLPGMPAGVQVAVAAAGDLPPGIGEPIPLPGELAQAMMQAGAFMAPPPGQDEDGDSEYGADEEETEMEIED